MNKLSKTKFNNESLKTFFNSTKKMRVNHIKEEKVIVQADNKLFVHIILSVGIQVYKKSSNIYRSHALVICRARWITENVPIYIIIDVAFDLYRKKTATKNADGSPQLKKSSNSGEGVFISLSDGRGP